MIQIGDTLPEAELHQGSPGHKVSTGSLFSGKRAILFGVPGAFTPGCNRTHLPGYINDAEDFHAKGISEIVCVAVNDAFVMAAWGEALGADGKVRLLADPTGAFTKAMGLEVNATALGGLRSKRYAMIVDNGVVTHLELEPDGFGLSCSLSSSMIDRA